ncbi:MAG: hypothetical protein EOP49_39110 [Sphingobacteriales bacterium]|nr:MAG: hypothetical protein EOP49_39110 [Sphingobacteriales bacterium]
MPNRNTNLITELRAGTVTFLTMAYIISVNANIIAETGYGCNHTCTPLLVPVTAVDGFGSGTDLQRALAGALVELLTAP